MGMGLESFHVSIRISIQVNRSQELNSTYPDIGGKESRDSRLLDLGYTATNRGIGINA
jgi:hypothetical protein